MRDLRYETMIDILNESDHAASKFKILGKVSAKLGFYYFKQWVFEKYGDTFGEKIYSRLTRRTDWPRVSAVIKSGITAYEIFSMARTLSEEELKKEQTKQRRQQLQIQRSK